MCQPIPSQWSNCFYDLIFHLIKFLHEPFVSLIKFLLNYLILSNSIFDFFYKDIDTFSCFNFVQFCNFFFPLPFYLCLNGLQQFYFSIPSFFLFLLFLHSPYLYLYSIFHCFFLSLHLDPNILFLFLLFFFGLCTCLFFSSPSSLPLPLDPYILFLPIALTSRFPNFFPPSLLPCFLFCVCVSELIIFPFLFRFAFFLFLSLYFRLISLF